MVGKLTWAAAPRRAVGQQSAPPKLRRWLPTKPSLKLVVVEGSLVVAARPPGHKQERRQHQKQLEIRPCLHGMGLARAGGQSILEGHAVKEATAQLYVRMLAGLAVFARRAGEPSGSAEEDEVILLEWADAAFVEIEFSTAFCQAAASAGLSRLWLVPHSLRHAGPSWGALTHRRSQREIQRRGRWASATSVVRYERSSKVTSLLQELPPRTRDYLQRCNAQLCSTLHGGRPPSMSGL